MTHQIAPGQLAILERDELKSLWQAEIGPMVPKNISRKMIAQIIIVERQWAANRQSSVSYRKKLKRIAEAQTSTRQLANRGSRLIREWNGRRHVVDVLPDGYLWNGKTWRSLSAIAQEITGTKWSGPRFFGVAG